MGTRGRVVWEVDHVVPELVSSVTNPLGLGVRVGHVIESLTKPEARAYAALIGD